MSDGKFSPNSAPYASQDWWTEHYNLKKIYDPWLTPGSTFQPVMQTPKEGELIKAPSVDPPGMMAKTSTTGPAATAAGVKSSAAPRIDAAKVGDQTPTMQGEQGQVSQGAQVEAAQGGPSAEFSQTLDSFNQELANTQVDPRALVQHQFAQLMSFGPGEIPAWAAGAYKTAMQEMAARGITSSTMMGEAVTSALVQAALPIAAQDAKVFETMTLSVLDKKAQSAFLRAGHLANLDLANLNNRQQAAVVNAQSFLQMDLSNLSNRQQAAVITTQARLQTLLSDQAAENATRQINAANQIQVEQFFANLAAQIQTFNASQLNEMSRFNTGEVNAMNRFNSTLADERERFNAEMNLVTQQANAQYLRAINTQNTAMLNEANLINSQNLLEISNTALANQMQLLRDREAMTFQASQNQLNRAENRAIMLLNRDIAFSLMDRNQKDQMAQLLGRFAFNTLGNLLSS